MDLDLERLVQHLFAAGEMLAGGKPWEWPAACVEHVEWAEEIVDSVSTTVRVDAEWLAFITARKTEELERIIAEENLNPEGNAHFH